MKVSSKIVLGFMLVMMICCISVVSATDINSTDDTLVTDDIAVDDVSEIVEDVEIDDISKDVVGDRDGEGIVTVNNTNYNQYFNESGYLIGDNIQTLIFENDFNEVSTDFGNFKITKSVGLQFVNATFHNIGFDLIGNNLILAGANFTGDVNATNGATINVLGDDVAVANVNINVNAPENDNFYAIDVQSKNNVRLLNNVITYTCGYNNTANYNYVIKGRNSPGLLVKNNTITAYLPLKKVNWDVSGSIDADYVAGVAIENSNVNLTGNDITVIGNVIGGSFPTLDAVIIAQSTDAHIEHNTIHENDVVTPNGGYSYIYGIDVYSCPNIKINNNTVVMNGNASGSHLPSGNGTGAAYCIQLSGTHSGVEIYDNTLTTQNQGPNLGIYSQNYHAASHLKIYNNRINVTGKAGSDPWSLVSGMELQDTSAEVYGNNITVKNTVNNTNYCAYGISYSQYTAGEHKYDIHNNNVVVENGKYAVYLDGVVNSLVYNNCLDTDVYCGDNAVYMTGDENDYYNNYCSHCLNCTSCHVCNP